MASGSAAAATKAAGKLVAVCLGSSGSVGTQLVSELVAHPAYGRVITLNRRHVPALDALATSTSVEQVVVDYANLSTVTARVVAAVKSGGPLPGTAADTGDAAGTAASGGAGTGAGAGAGAGAGSGTTAAAGAAVVAFNTIGVGKGTAKLTFDEHRAVDVELPKAFASGCIEGGGVQHFVHMSAIGADQTADPKSAWARYTRVKGDSEEAVKSACAGKCGVSVTRPAMIIGVPATPGILAFFMPAANLVVPGKYHSVSVEMLARSMAERGAQAAASYSGAAGATFENSVLHYPEMKALVDGMNKK